MATKQKERRTGAERRGDTKDPARKRERRMGDRRDSPRVPITINVKQGGSWLEADGDLSVGGAYFVVGETPEAGGVELKFKLPGVRKEIRTGADIIRVASNGGRFGVHVKFHEMETQDELAVAKFIDDHILQVP
ncbi:MAG: PilZ domain-containing protein [Myxococcales bacterium]